MSRHQQRLERRTGAAGGIGAGLLALLSGLARQADDVGRGLLRNVDDFGRATIHHVDDVSRAGARNGDDILRGMDELIRSDVVSGTNSDDTDDNRLHPNVSIQRGGSADLDRIMREITAE